MQLVRLVLWGLLLTGTTPTELWAHRGETHAPAIASAELTASADITAAIGANIIPESGHPTGIYVDVWFDARIFSLLFTIWVMYLLGIGPLRAKIYADKPFPWRHAILFTLGLVFYYLAVASSLDEIGEEYLFTAHMLQHNIMTYAIPLFILFGIPVWFADTVLAAKPLRVFIGFFTAPIVAFGVFNLALVIWHIPAMYEWALRDKVIHDLEHATFVLTALAMWWPIFSPSAKYLPPISHYGIQMLYIFGLAVMTMPILTFLCFSPQPHYPTYIAAPRITALSPIDDQFLGGVVMKGTAVVVYLAAWGHIFFRWARESAGRSVEPVATPIQ